MKNKNRELFNEAIADAKAIKNMAIANAKEAIAESFTPQIHSMLAAKLEEMENEELEEEVDLTAESEVSENEIDENAEQTNEEESANENVNLDELLAELESENEEVEEELNEDLDEAKKAEDKDEKDEDEEDEEIDLESMSQEDLEDFIKGVIKGMEASGELEGGNAEGSEEDEEEISIDEILKSLSEDENVKEGGSTHKPVNKKAVDAKSTEYYEKNEKVKEELAFANETINELRKTLNETNLLNSKLLYMNKIFKAKNLNESQKVKVLNAFDKAKTVAESRVVYNLLNESLTKTEKTPLKEHKSIASNVITSAKTVKKPILENADPMISRWRKIAGLG